MKKINKLFAIGFFMLFLVSTTAQNTVIKIGANPNTINASAVLEVESTVKGFLPPRMTTAQRDAINSGLPAEGLVVYNTDTKCLQFFNGSYWYDICTGEISGTPNGNLTVASPSYQGVSVINSQGIGYNGEVLPAASTITVQLSNSSADVQNYALFATDASTGLQYSASGSIAGSASGVSVVLNHNEPNIAWDFFGTISMSLEGASAPLALAPRIDVKSIPATETAVIPVTYGTQIWMDRNLGARRPAEAINDVLSYGNHYQWGRPADGHEISVWNGDSQTDGRGFYDATALEALATSGTPGHPYFILTIVAPFDWVNKASVPDPSRWANANQGPCPAGYHVPTEAEWDTADTAALGSGSGTGGTNTTGWDNNLEIYESALKLPSAGRRNREDGLLNLQGTHGRNWSSTVDGTGVRRFLFDDVIAMNTIVARAPGLSVRCIKD